MGNVILAIGWLSLAMYSQVKGGMRGAAVFSSGLKKEMKKERERKKRKKMIQKRGKRIGRRGYK